MGFSTGLPSRIGIQDKLFAGVTKEESDLFFPLQRQMQQAGRNRIVALVGSFSQRGDEGEHEIG